MAARVTKFDIEILVDPNASPAVPENGFIDIVPIVSIEEFGIELDTIYGQFIEGDSIISSEDFGSELNLFTETYIDNSFVSSIESFGNDNNLLIFIDSTPIESAEDLIIESLYSEYAFDQTSIDSIEEFAGLFIDLLVDPIFINTDENFGTELDLYPENYIYPNYLESEEILILERLHAEAYIYPNSISSQETFKKHLVFPKPFPGYIYNWYEKLIEIETELNVRVK